MFQNGNVGLQKLANVDMTPAIDYHCKKNGVEREIALLAAEELKKWLVLCVIYQDADFPMMRGEMDSIWHSTVLYTPVYLELCRALGEDYIHHVPCLDDLGEEEKARELKDREKVRLNYGKFLDAYQKEFGELEADNQFWPRYHRMENENCTVSSPIYIPGPGCRACGIRG